MGKQNNYLWRRAALSKRWLYCIFPTFKLPGPFLSRLPVNHDGISPWTCPKIGSNISFSHDLNQTETSQFGYNLVFLSSIMPKLWFVSNFFCFNIFIEFIILDFTLLTRDKLENQQISLSLGHSCSKFNKVFVQMLAQCSDNCLLQWSPNEWIVWWCRINLTFFRPLIEEHTIQNKVTDETI